MPIRKLKIIQLQLIITTISQNEANLQKMF